MTTNTRSIISVIDAINSDQFLKGITYLILGTLLFSSKAIFIKLSYQYSVNPTVLMTLRMLFSIPIYLLILKRQCQNTIECKQLNKKQIALTALIGLTGYYAAAWLDLAGLVYLPANMERIILYTYPGFVVILSVFFLGKKLQLNTVISLSLVYLGLFIALTPEITNLSTLNNVATESNYNIGIFLIIASAACFAVFMIGSDIMMRKLSSTLFTSIAMIAASVGIFIHYASVHSFNELITQQKAVYFYSFIIAMFCTVLPSFLIASGIRRVGASTASIVSGIGPITTLVLASIMLNESITIIQLFGFAIVLGGLLIIAKIKK